ncbi:MAG: glutamate 5-kinase, partial [Acidimicrobiales bacterium]
MATLTPLAHSNCVTVKIGSALLVDQESGHINQNWLADLGQDIAALKQAGKDVIIVSSGAIALGRQRLGFKKSKLTLAEKQASAAAGQSVLTRAYEDVLAPFGIVTAQALLTLNDTEDRRRWINARETLTTLISVGAIPIINENDTVATDEIRYGDNDRLAARVAQMVGADCLVLLSDVDGLYDKNPTLHEDATHIPQISSLTPEIMKMGGDANQTIGVGSGGMATKLQAAKIATEAGCAVAITKGNETRPLTALMEGKLNASWFIAQTSSLAARKQWIAGSLKPQGAIIIDAGAANALANGKSLLAAGVTDIRGQFEKGDAVEIHGPAGTCLGRGLCGYSAAEAIKIKGLKSGDIEATLG